MPAVSTHPRRIALYSHDTRGLGHTGRNTTLAAALVAAHSDTDVLLVTGNPDLLTGDDPAVDLASATAAAQLDGGRAGRPEDAAALLGGYATVRSLPPARQLAAHTAAALLRRAPEPFRLAAPSWPDGVREALTAAEEALS